MFYNDFVSQAKKEAEELREKAKELVKDHPLYGKKFTLWTKIIGSNIDHLWYSDAATSHSNGLSGVVWDDGIRWSTKLKALEMNWVLFEAGVNPNIDHNAEPLVLPPDYLKLYGVDFKKVYGHLPKAEQSKYKLEAYQRQLETAKEAVKEAEMNRPKGIIGEWIGRLKQGKQPIDKVPAKVRNILSTKYNAVVEDGFIYIP